jgi:hypothetical protein
MHGERARARFVQGPSERHDALRRGGKPAREHVPLAILARPELLMARVSSRRAATPCIARPHAAAGLPPPWLTPGKPAERLPVSRGGFPVARLSRGGPVRGRLRG